MTSHLTRFFFLGLLVFSFLGTAPLPATAAGLVPCGRTIGTAEEQQPCTVCHIVVLGNNIVAYGLKLMTYAGLAVIVAMAIFYIVSTGDEGMMKTAKSGITAALIGFAVLLGAWLIVNTTLRILSVDKIEGLTISSSGFGFTCDTSSTTQKP